ncbi:MAG: hypothetical protein NVS9B14_03150 [Candidatus Acidiferrum sp.]
MRKSATTLMHLSARIFVILAIVSGTGISVTRAQSPSDSPPGVRKMAKLLEDIYASQDWKSDPNKPAARAEYYRDLLTKNPPLGTEFKIRLALAESLLEAGDSAAAVTELETARTRAKESGVILTPKFETDLRETLAIAYLRLGEQENCVVNHGQSSCLFPIRPEAVHQLTRGSAGAVRELTALLQADPKSFSSRWLLNIAYMTLGKYPAEVPEQWLIPPAKFESDFDIGRFKDVATDVGLRINGHSGGAIMEDFDGDGLLDLMVSSSGPRDQLRFFHNNGDGTFTDRTKEAGLIGETGGLNIVVTDYNNDGHPDVLVLRGGWWGEHGNYPMSLLRNNGDGTFEDVTEQAGLLSLAPSQTAAWADYDGDGWLDLFVGHESSDVAKHPSQLFHNNHDGTFTEVAAPNGLADLGFVKGVAWGDYNNDGRPDLYVSIKGKPNRLFRNDGPADPQNPKPDRWKFKDVTTEAGVAEPIQSFATWFFDFDNDGWPPWFVAGFYVDSPDDMAAFELGLPSKAETPRLYHNNHDGTFTDVSKRMGLDSAILVMGSGFGDLDNDGWLDVYLGTGDVPYSAVLPNKMFRNDGGKRFQDVTTSGGFGHLQKGHGVSFGDINNDGNEEVFEKMGGAFPGDNYASVLYENPGHGNHWISLDLAGVRTNRAAFGAKICVKVKTKEGERKIYRTVGYGSSFGGNPLRQHIGIGTATRIEEIEIFWPVSKTTQRFRDIAADKWFRVKEGEQKLQQMNLKPLAFRHMPEDPHQHPM